MEYTQDIMKQIEDVVEKQAAQMVGTDADKEKLEQAKKLARAAIMDEIEAEVIRQRKERADMVEDYNAFYTREAGEADFPQVQQYAVEEHFDTLTAAEQFRISDAYRRIENNTATAADIETVKAYFTEAKEAYLMKKGAAAC